jgi:PadR family transcriptional regulator, regulatory protein AphA
VRELTTTSYALLSLLAVQPFTTYQLAKQMERSLRDMWPRAESVVYDEPKRLAAEGYATATVEHVGRRASTTYAITAKGRRALKRWLVAPGSGPVLEFEALLKVAFADFGDLDGLRANLAAIRTHAEEERSRIVERVDEYRSTGGPYPDRLPVIALVVRFHDEVTEAHRRWAEWAEREVASWKGVTPEAGAGEPAWEDSPA